MRSPNSASRTPSSDRIVGSIILAGVALQLPMSADAGAGVFTYYDDPFAPPGSAEILRVGPASWPDLLIPDNQCGGTDQHKGYGQSPIVVPRSAGEKCDTNLDSYVFEAGDCTYHDLDFHIVNNGVVVAPGHHGGETEECFLGKMKIPGNDNWYEAKHIHIRSSSEHSVEGKFYPAELHIVHKERGGKSYAIFASFIDDKHDEKKANNTSEHNLFEAIQDKEHDGENLGLHVVEGIQDGAHEVFETFLQGWEAVATQTEEFCAAKPEGSGIFTPNRLFTSQQHLIQCGAVAGEYTPEMVADLQWVKVTRTNPLNYETVTEFVPELEPPHFPSGPIPSLYESLPNKNDFSMYTYRGSLTVPPCMEKVHWNILDEAIHISPSQLERLSSLILCFVERSTCRHSTVASHSGGTTRPPQSLNGRTVLHRCSDGPDIFMADAKSPVLHADHHDGGGHVHLHPHYALLYPWFVLALGFVVYYLLSRFAHFIPYTAIMFVLGTFMGIGIVSLENTDQLSLSTWMWKNINAEVLLLVFLPGLLFRDAFCLNVYLLKDALVQCLIMAFPMVLAGTVLVALVGFYILPYGWSFSLCMTFGAILSATDPVAVSALLNEVGAPPRLKMHIAGESLLNDGSAIVFFALFGSMFLFELGIPGLGKEIDAAAGVALFFRMSLGAVAIGLGFGLALVRVLHHFNRRFQVEEAIVQVMSTITIAYLTYYIAEPVCHTSGVIAVVTCGAVTKAFGENLINDKVMMEKFWLLVEHMLNTLIFALGGAVWGTVISNSDPRRSETFSGKDWAYLFLLYVLIFIIRAFLFTAFFPIISRIGLKSNWREAAFITFGGLRGAVGIAMAIALDNELRHETVPGDPRRDLTSQLFGLTGGISFLTLLINGMLCGPFLRKLGLADSTEMREKIVKEYRHGVMQDALDRLLAHLSDPRFERADFAIVRRHVPALRDVGFEDLKLAVKRQKANTPKFEYKRPNLESFRSFIGEGDMSDLIALARVNSSTKLQDLVKRTALANISVHQEAGTEEEEVNETEMVELRKLFIELLRFAYMEQIDNGEVEVREGFIVFTLEKSLEYASDAVTNGEPLCDWEKMQKLSHPWQRQTKEILDIRSSDVRQRLRGSAIKNLRSSEIGNQLRGSVMMDLRSSTVSEQLHEMNLEEGEATKEDKQAVGDIQRTVSFIAAHQTAQKTFKDKFCSNRLLTAGERQLLDESRKQVSKGEELLDSIESAKLDNTISHLLCTILLNGTASYIGNLITNGLLKEMEGEEYLHEYVEHELYTVRKCVKKKECRMAHEEVEGENNGMGGGDDGKSRDEEGSFADELKPSLNALSA